VDFAQDMANREGCAVDVAIHAPHREGDSRNHHAHILRTTRKVEAAGLGDKLDTEKAGRSRVADLEAVRVRWAALTNERLRDNGIGARIDHRSLEAQGIKREPTRHLGPAATGYERRTGEPSWKRLQFEREAGERLERAKELGELERQNLRLDRSVIDLTGDLSAAKAERDRQLTEQVRQAAAAGMAAFRAQFEQVRQVEAGKQQALEAFQRFKAEQQAQQRQAELARQQAEQREKTRAQEIADRLEKQRAERETKKAERDGPDLSR
jgi:hypothetical protein